MPNVFDVLRRDHLEVKQMLAELETGPTAATGADDTQLALRKKMAEELVIEESRHEAVEEMYFWPVVRERVTNGNGLADQAIAQESEAKKSAPARPHPRTPASPGVLKATGPAAAAADKARDAVPGRGVD